MESKMSEQLTEHLRGKGESGLLDLVVELHQSDREATAPQSQTENIAALKETFSRNVARLEETVRRIGGEVTGRAWINQTIRVRAPADKIDQISSHDEVAKIDLPHTLERDFSK